MESNRNAGTPPPPSDAATSPHTADGSTGTASGTRGASAPQAATGTAAKADLGKRFIAALIDGVVASVLGGVIPVVGGLLGTAYILVRDGLEVDFMRRRSLGKHLMKLRPVRLDGQPVDLETSFRRNWMFGLGALTWLLVFIPILGWILIPFVGLVALGIGLYEIYKVVTDDEGRRWGDAMAGTKVIEVDE